MSTPCGTYELISPASFSERVFSWNDRIKFCEFLDSDYREIFRNAKK